MVPSRYVSEHFFLHFIFFYSTYLILQNLKYFFSISTSSEPDEWVLESEVQSTKNVGIRKVAASHPEEVSLALFSAVGSTEPSSMRVKQRRKPAKNS